MSGDNNLEKLIYAIVEYHKLYFRGRETIVSRYNAKKIYPFKGEYKTSKINYK